MSLFGKSCASAAIAAMIVFFDVPVHASSENIHVADSSGRRSIPKCGEEKRDSLGQIIPNVVVLPRYPQKALRDGIEGEVVLSFDVARDGYARNIFVILSTSGAYFDEVAIAALKRTKFFPCLKDGKANGYTGQTRRYEFRLPRDPAKSNNALQPTLDPSALFAAAKSTAASSAAELWR